MRSARIESVHVCQGVARGATVAGVAMKTLQQFNDDRRKVDSESEIGELMTDSAVNDAQRMSDRLLQLRRGLRDLLTLGDSGDAAWSRYFSDVASTTRQ